VPNLNALDQRMNIRTIVWPIFVESLLRLSMMTIDVLMLSRYSDDAVAAVGLTGSFIFFLLLTYTIVSSGSAIVMGQALGAQQQDDATAYAQSGLLLAILLSFAVGLVFFFASSSVVALYSLEPAAHQYAVQYLTIVGSLSIGMSVSILLAVVLRAHGFSKSPMMIQMLAAAINVCGNYLALFAPFGLPETGVVGVAFSTVVSQLIAAAAGFCVLIHQRVPFSLRNTFRFDLPRLTAILKVGIPNGAEGLSYNMSQITIMFFVAQFGTAALAAVAITQTVTRFTFVFAMSVGGGAQIMASYMVGQNRSAELKSMVHRLWVIGVAVSFGSALAMVLLRAPLAAFFTSDPATQTLIGLLILASLLLEPGRAINLIVLAALKGSGDVVFPVKVGVLSMWGVGVLLAYALGLHWSWGLVGIWVAMGLDECTRGLIMIHRWHSEQWTRFRTT